MTFRTIAVAAITAGVTVTGCAASQNEAVARRVARDFASVSANAPFRHYAVPAMSELQRLPDAFPADGVAGGVVTIVAARDEYEPGSFLLYGLSDVKSVQLSLGEFRNEKGDVFPADDLDLKVVKVWYQNRNAWFSYFGDTGFKLVPELLLNDENLIRVDEKKAANYARLVAKDGKKSEFWLNPPRQLDAQPKPNQWFRHGERFMCMKEGFDDAATLQPVKLEKGRFKQFFLTAHVRKDAKPGLYRGVVKVGDRGEVPVAIRVLDFALPKPKTYRDPKKDFLVSSYNYVCPCLVADLNGGDDALAIKQMTAVLKNQVEHGQTMHWCRESWSPEALVTLDVMQKAGMRMDVIQGGVNPLSETRHTPAELRAHAQLVADEYVRRYGHHNVFTSFGDEPQADWVQKVRPVYEAYQSAGLLFCIAGSDVLFHRAGYLYDWHNISKRPEDASTPTLWNDLQRNTRVAWYANQHVGAENPALNRRQNGLTPWLSGYGALCNYAHHLDTYNDDTEGYRPMVFAYGRYGGVIDTLQWEGFREGVDDIRYATLMADLARKAEKAKDVETRYLGGQAMQLLAGLDRTSYDQDRVRGEMIRFIEALRTRVAPYVESSDWKLVSAEERAAATKRVEDGLARDLAEAKKGFLTARNLNATNAVHEKVAAVYEKYYRFDEAGAYLEGVGLDAQAARRCYRWQPEKFVRACLKTLNDRKAGWYARGRAFWDVLPYRPDVAGMLGDAYLSDIRPADTNAMKRRVGDWAFGGLRGRDSRDGRHHYLVASGRHAAYTAAYEAGVKLADRLGVVVDYPIARLAFEAYYLQGRTKEAAAAAQRGLADPKIKPGEAYLLKFAVAMAGLKDADAPKFLDFAKSFDAKEKGDATSKDRVKAVCEVGSVVRAGGHEALVRALDEFRLSFYRPTPKKRCVVQFSDRPVDGIGDWDRIPAKEEVYDRRYGGNLDVLLTDVTTGGRSTGASKDAVPDPTMKVVADENGLHVFVRVADPKAKEVSLGSVGGGSFECYVAPGENTPYVCLCMDPGRRSIHFFNTTYPTFGQRMLCAEDSNDYRLETRYLDDAVISHLFLSWRIWPTQVPADGSVWDFENMFWNRTGNACWNGTQSIHGRSTWGEFEFRLTPAQRRRILTPLLANAAANFKRERVCTGAHDGVFAYWKDSALGDPAFYEAELKELEEKLAKYVEILSPDMSDSTFDFLVREALPQWTDVAFEASRRRARWLEAKQMK